MRELASKIMQEIQHESFVRKVPVVFLNEKDIELLLFHHYVEPEDIESYEIKRKDYRLPFTSQNLKIDIKIKKEVG